MIARNLPVGRLDAENSRPPGPETRHVPLAALVLAALAASPAAAQERNDAVVYAPTFLVRVSVDKPDRVYREGDKLVVAVPSEKAGFLYLFNVTPDGRVNCLCPNKHQRDNTIKANTSIRGPADDAPLAFPIQGPTFGVEHLRAVVTLKPLDQIVPGAAEKGVFKPAALIAGIATAIKPEALDTAMKDIGVTGKPAAGKDEADRVALVAEHRIEVLTLRKGDPVPPPMLDGQPPPKPPPKPPAAPRAKRVGMFVGVGKFKDASLDPLAADKDAEAMHTVMTTRGKLDEAVLLVNERATLVALADLFVRRLPAATRPGDEVVVYWSGHGGQVPNTDGTEPDGQDEFLVTHDGSLATDADARSTMLLDKTFWRWVQGLDGRRVVVILDECHSGGQAGAKVLKPRLVARAVRNPVSKTFFAAELARAKSVGQREVTVLAAARAEEIAWFRPEFGGVMTHFLIEKLRAGSGPETLADAFAAVEKSVPAYVLKNLPDVKQTLTLMDATSPLVFLVP